MRPLKMFFCEAPGPQLDFLGGGFLKDHWFFILIPGGIINPF